VQLFGTKGQKFLHCPGTKGQQDKLKILPWDGTGRDSMSKYGTGRGTGQSLFFCQNPGRDAGRDGTGKSLFFPIISCFRTYLSVLVRTFPVLERPFLF
jgi:hypothetical protein